MKHYTPSFWAKLIQEHLYIRLLTSFLYSYFLIFVYVHAQIYIVSLLFRIIILLCSENSEHFCKKRRKKLLVLDLFSALFYVISLLVYMPTLQCPPMVGLCPGRTLQHLVMVPMAKLNLLSPENEHHLMIVIIIFPPRWQLHVTGTPETGYYSAVLCSLIISPLFIGLMLQSLWITLCICR